MSAILTPTEMKIRAVVPWFGSKRSMADDIVIELGPHRSFYDLGCGSLAVTMNKAVSAHETAIDLHWHLINLVRIIQEESTAVILYDRLQRVICSEEIFERSREVITANPMLDDADLGSVDFAYHYFLTQWMGRNGVSGTKRLNYQMAVRWTPGGGHGGIRFRSATESIPWWHQRLRPVIVMRRCMFEVLPRIEDVAGVVIYVDPPYLLGTRGACEYEYEFKHDEDMPLFMSRTEKRARQTHERLADELSRFKKARVVISYYDHPRLRKLYAGWTFQELYRQKNLHVQNRRGAGAMEAPEILIINGPSYAEAL